MARPIKENAEYFTHDADASSDEKIEYLESKFGNDGYAFFFKMCERLTRADGFEIELTDVKKEILAKKFNLTINRFEEILQECLRPEIKAFVVRNGTIHSPGLKNRLAPLVDKRLKMRERYSEQKASAVNGVSASEMRVSEAESTQSKVKKSKVLKDPAVKTTTTELY